MPSPAMRRILWGGGGFSPASLANLSLWLRADAGALNGSGAPAAAGDPVATWTGQGGTGVTVVQATTAKMPTFSTALLNGLPYLIFDGTDDVMSISVPPFGAAGGDFSLFAVFSATSNVFRVAGQGSVANGIDAGITGVGQPLSRCVAMVQSATTVEDPAALSSGVFYCVSGVVAAAGSPAVVLRKNGSQVASGTFSAWPGGDTGFYVGGNPAQSVFLAGNVAEAIGYNRALSVAEIVSVEKYLSSRWGLGF